MYVCVCVLSQILVWLVVKLELEAESVGEVSDLFESVLVGAGRLQFLDDHLFGVLASKDNQIQRLVRKELFLLYRGTRVKKLAISKFKKKTKDRLFALHCRENMSVVRVARERSVVHV